MQTIKNHITLIGNMASPAQITNFENGNKVARFNMATHRTYGKEQKTEWHKVFAWGNMANFIENYGEKGKQVAIHGRLVNRTYLSKDGEPRKSTEVEVKHIIGL